MKFVKVVSRKEGFRRAGRAWACAETVAEVTGEQFEALSNEPMLAVVEMSADDYAAATGIEPAGAESKGRGKKA